MKNLIPESYKGPGLFVFAVIFFVTGFAVYSQSLNNVLFFDDEHLILNNSYIKEINIYNIGKWFTENSFSGAGRISEYYRPLLLFTFAINYFIDGVRPIGYHIFNTLLHSINAIMVFWLLNSYVFKKKWQSFLVSFIFLVHPMQTEGVAYVSGRGDLLATFFIFSGIIFWLKSIESNKKIFFLFSSYMSLIFALLSRENAVVFPFLVFVLYVSFLSKDRFLKSITEGFLKIIPYLVIVAVYLTLRLTILNFRDFLNFGNYDTSSLYAQSFLVRMYTFCHVFLEYMRTLFYPTNVYEKFYFPVSYSVFSMKVWPSIFIFGSILFILYKFYKKASVFYKQKKKNKGEDSNTDFYLQQFKIWFFGWGWFFVSLSPGSGIIPANVIFQDHRLYIAMIGIFSIVAYYTNLLFDYLDIKKFLRIKILLIFIILFYLSFNSYITIKRSIIWGKPIDLFEETLKYEPESVLAYNSLGKYLIDKGDYIKAEEYLIKAIQKNSFSPNPYHNMGEIRYFFGQNKNVKSAIWYYKKAIEIEPKFFPSYRRLAMIYMELGSSEAIYYLKKMLEFNPNQPDPYYNLSLVYYLLGDKVEALKYLNLGLPLVLNNKEAEGLFLELRNKIEGN